MIEFSHVVYEIVIWLFILYSVSVFLIYLWIAIYALKANLEYKNDNKFTDYSIISTNPNAPMFSLIAPAYNEGMTIVENVRSLLSLYYQNLEIIIINDGSKDDSIVKLIKEYELESVSFLIQGQLETNEVRGVYKSKNPAFKKLIVVDKENGGKADALNVGINISSGDYLVCIDVDCILEQDALLKLAKPFLEQTEKKIIACGGVIRLANNCKVENGKILEVNIPKSRLGRAQALEYIRAFVLGRMAWSRASGLILISGAFGAFERKTVLACGGYDKNTVGEDMELVVRMRRYMEELNEPYEVVNIPDPLCWTEVPESKEILQKQRNRWMRGTMETLWKHRKMMFNPKYGKLGMISLPYWLFFELLGPLIEFSGYFLFFIFLIFGIINWQFFLLLFALVISTGILYSIYSILVDLLSKQVYTKRKDFFALITTAVLEPFNFHPIVVRAGVKGFVDYFKKSHGWGEMTRQGFTARKSGLTWKEKIAIISQEAFRKWGMISLVFLVLFTLSVITEWQWYIYKQSPISAPHLFINNITFASALCLFVGILYWLMKFINEFWARCFILVVYSVVVVWHFVLFLFFEETQTLLGAETFYFSLTDVEKILEMGGILKTENIVFMILLVLCTTIPLWITERSNFKADIVAYGLFAIAFIWLVLPKEMITAQKTKNKIKDNASESKWIHFFQSNTDDFLEEHPEINHMLNKDQNQK